MTTIFFISPTSSQPRYHKRVAHLSAFCPVKVFSFQRGYYEQNTFPAGTEYYSLGRMKDQHYFQRLFLITKAVLSIRKKRKKAERCFFYAMGIECVFIAVLSGIKRGFYEVGDIKDSKFWGTVLRMAEKLIRRNLAGLVLTTKYYFDDFYKGFGLVAPEKTYIIDNKLNLALSNKRPTGPKASGPKIVVGLIGLLRFKDPIEFLLKFIQERSDLFELKCYGDGLYRPLIESRVCDYIHYYGSFKNPDDLPNIYREVDLNYTVYDYFKLNMRLAIPNKLYESAFFGLPILCGYNTAVGKKAVSWGIGREIRLDAYENYVADMSTITRNWIRSCSAAGLKIPSSELIDDSEVTCRRLLSENGVISTH